ncbi:hypothetical protein ACDY96_10620 [Rhizobium mongolense]|uniref:hypothetical protein n=1 Tax=Rhizobium mongolense TaxID=57676 RepID=UPI003556E17F
MPKQIAGPYCSLHWRLFSSSASDQVNLDRGKLCDGWRKVDSKELVLLHRLKSEYTSIFYTYENLLEAIRAAAPRNDE